MLSFLQRPGTTTFDTKFDLTADPHCLNNVAADPAYATARLEMAERLLSWRAEHLDQTLALTELTEGGVVSRR